MCHPCDATPGQDPHAFADLELFIRRLGDGDHPAAVEPDGDFNPRLAGGAFFHRGAGDAADDGAQDATYDLTFAAAHLAAGHAADHGSGGAADAGFGAFDLDFAHGFHHAHLYLLNPARLSAFVVASAETAGAAGK